jgi:hypothetical protein
MSLIHAIAGSVANAAGGFTLGDEMWEQLDHVSLTGNATDITFTSAGSASAWSGYRDLVFYMRGKGANPGGYGFTETSINLEINDYDLATTSNRQYYNYNMNNAVKGSSYANREYSNMGSGVGNAYANNFAWISGASGNWDDAPTTIFLTMFDINNNKTKYMQTESFTPVTDTSGSQNVHHLDGMWNWYGTSGRNSSVPAITKINFLCKESGNGHQFANGMHVSCFGIKDT